MISDISFLNGICALILICTAVIFGITGIKLYRNTQTANFLNLVLLSMAIFVGWLGITISFFSVLFLGENINLNTLKLIVNITAFVSEPLGAFAVMNSNWGLLGSPKHKKLALGIFVIYSIFYYIVLIWTFNQAIVCPDVASGEILNNWVNPSSLFYYVFWGIVVVAGAITFAGFSKFGKATSGGLRKRAYYVIFASGFIMLGILLDTVIFTYALAYQFDFISRLLVIPGLIFIYYGFRPLK
jgi:hypothetical protein